MLKHLATGAGILLTILGHCAENSEPASLIGRTLAPRFAAATAGYDTLLKEGFLSPPDKGYQEIVELAIANGLEIAPQNTLGIRYRGRSGLNISPPDRRIQAGPTVDIDVTVPGQNALRVTIRDPEKSIKEIFFDTSLVRYAALAFWSGILLVIITWVAKLYIDLRKQTKSGS